MVAEVAVEVVEKKSKKKAESVWVENLEAHRERLINLRRIGSELPEPSIERDMLANLYNVGGGWTTRARCGSYLHTFYHQNDLDKARKCIEFAAACLYHTHTRLRSWQDWEKAGLPQWSEAFYQDARLCLSIRFDEEQQKLVPMTMDEMMSEYMDILHRHAASDMQEQFNHANSAAADAVKKWAEFKPCGVDGPTLYRRGDYASFFKKSAAGNDLYRRAKEDWELGKATLLQYPRFEAVQVVENKSAVRVTMYEGDNALETWVDNNPPYRSELIHPRRNIEKFAIGFLPCPPNLYAAYLGQKYIKPGSAEEYAWEDALPNPACEFNVDAKAFIAALKHGVVAASDDMSRPILCAVFLKVQTWDELTVVSTDTYRLLLQDIDVANVTLTDGNAALPNVLLPRQFCGFIAKAMKHPVGQMRLRCGRTKESGDVDIVEITGETMERKQPKPVQFVTRTIDGQFVNYTKVVPNSHQHTIIVDPETMVQKLNEMLRVACNDSNRVIVTNQTFGDGPKRLRLEANNDGQYITVTEADDANYFTGKQHMEMPLPVERIEGCPENFAFNAEYAIDYLAWQDGPVSWEINGPLNSFVFRNGRSQCVLMPMQIMY